VSSVVPRTCPAMACRRPFYPWFRRLLEPDIKGRQGKDIVVGANPRRAGPGLPVFPVARLSLNRSSRRLFCGSCIQGEVSGCFRDVVDDPVDVWFHRRFGILDNKGKTPGPFRDILPAEGRRFPPLIAGIPGGSAPPVGKCFRRERHECPFALPGCDAGDIQPDITMRKAARKKIASPVPIRQPFLVKRTRRTGIIKRSRGVRFLRGFLAFHAEETGRSLRVTLSSGCRSCNVHRRIRRSGCRG
jgi:hypothetical protein